MGKCITHSTWWILPCVQSEAKMWPEYQEYTYQVSLRFPTLIIMLQHGNTFPQSPFGTRICNLRKVNEIEHILKNSFSCSIYIKNYFYIAKSASKKCN